MRASSPLLVHACALVFSCVPDDVRPAEVAAEFDSLVTFCGRGGTLTLVESDLEDGPYVASHADGMVSVRGFALDGTFMRTVNGVDIDVATGGVRQGERRVTRGRVKWTSRGVERTACVSSAGSFRYARDDGENDAGRVVAVLSLDGEGDGCATPLSGTVLACW